MIALSSLQNLRDAKQRMDEIQHSSPELFAHLRHIVHLTKQMEFRSSYLGSMLRNQEADEEAVEPYAHPSVLRLYRVEVDKLKNRRDAEKGIQLFEDFRSLGDRTICQLIIGDSPESIKGVS